VHQQFNCIFAVAPLMRVALPPKAIMTGHSCKAVTSESKNLEEAILASLYWTVPHYLDECDVPCAGCGALHWRKESTLDQRGAKKIKFSTCCQKGKVTIPSANSGQIRSPNGELCL
jgi:hypothetical protein